MRWFLHPLSLSSPSVHSLPRPRPLPPPPPPPLPSGSGGYVVLYHPHVPIEQLFLSSICLMCAELPALSPKFKALSLAIVLHRGFIYKNTHILRKSHTSSGQ